MSPPEHSAMEGLTGVDGQYGGGSQHSLRRRRVGSQSPHTSRSSGTNGGASNPQAAASSSSSAFDEGELREWSSAAMAAANGGARAARDKAGRDGVGGGGGRNTNKEPTILERLRLQQQERDRQRRVQEQEQERERERELELQRARQQKQQSPPTSPKSLSASTTAATTNESHWTVDAIQSIGGAASASASGMSSSVVGGASSGAAPPLHENLALVDVCFRYLSAGCVVTWLLLIGVSYYMTPPEHIQSMEGAERTAPVVGFVVLTVSTLSWVLPLFLQQGSKRLLSGIMVGGITVQVIAALTELLLAVAPVPVLADPVTGLRVHLLRWCEWTPLAFLMTFLTEGIDVPKKGREGLKVPFLHALCQGLSTVCGLIFPFTYGIWDWSFWMVVSCLLFVVIFFRLRYKVVAFRNVDPGKTVDDIEIYERARLSLVLLWTCAAMWSLLVVSYFFDSVAPMFFPDDSIMKHPALTMVSEVTMDVVLKVLYLKIIINVHESVFDDKVRAERRLKELREMMSVVWGSSSDVIIVSVKGIRGTITTMASPTYLNISRKSGRKKAAGGDSAGGGSKVKSDHSATRGGGGSNEPKPIVFEFDPTKFQGQETCDKSATAFDPSQDAAAPSSLLVHEVDFAGLPSAHFVDSSDPSASSREGGNDAAAPDHPVVSNSDALGQEELLSLANLMCRAWRTENDAIFSHELNTGGSGGAAAVRFEAKINRLNDSALVMMLRDTSERSRRFEAEKRFVSEATARKKDAEANRFTRHEVKNGLLAAIGLCDSFADSLKQIQELQREKDAAIVDSSTDLCLHELDRTLHDVLDMVLADAMARDIIHDVYEPRMEYVDICSALSGLQHLKGYQAKNDRFPLIVHPSPLPRIRCDPQLLKHIHQNAVSNACKYGKKGGAVMTEIIFHDGPGTLEMLVKNLPGPRQEHDRIRELGDLAEEMVFTKGQRLHEHLDEHSRQSMHSTGDGAWIMRKCAKTMGGVCSIEFEEERTVFSFRCPATALEETNDEDADIEAKNAAQFHIPEGTWGIAIDDSKIQRKLLERFMTYAGLEEDRCIVLGKNSDEINGFVDFVIDFLDQHPDDHCFLIADENLDVVEDDAKHVTISGSLCIESIRKRILPDQEMRLLALVRSANDSSHDIAVYNSRAHGFIPKAPLQRDRVKDMIAPLWEKRYPRSILKPFYSSDTSSADRRESMTAEVMVPRSELMQAIESIDDTCSVREELLPDRWSLIWEKLHSLKGDLLTFHDNDEVHDAVKEISALRGPHLPLNFVSRWKVMRSHIVSALDNADK